VNIIGHNYIAYKVLGVFDKYTYAGSHIPDLVPFLPSSVFKFNEIHENHEGLLEFIKEQYPKAVNLPLSMMCHSYKYGTDKFNTDIVVWLLNHDEKLKDKIANKIASISNVPFEIARGGRLHNYLWCGFDIYLMKKNTDRIVDKLIYIQKDLDLKEIAHILSEYYKKNPFDVEKNLKDHFRVNQESFKSVEGYTKTYKEYLSVLSEGDDLNIEKGQELLEYIDEVFENEWEVILNNVTQKVSAEIDKFKY
jgi:hypothetical protein